MGQVSQDIQQEWKLCRTELVVSTFTPASKIVISYYGPVTLVCSIEALHKPLDSHASLPCRVIVLPLFSFIDRPRAGTTFTLIIHDPRLSPCTP